MVSNFTSMSPDEWNKSDSFYLELFSSMNPMDRGFEGLEKVLEVIESLDPGLRPDKMSALRSSPELLAPGRAEAAP